MRLGPKSRGWERGLVQSSGRLDDGGAAPIMRVRRTARCARGASRRGRPGCVGRRPRVAGAERGRPTVRRGWLGSARDAASWQPAPPSSTAGSSLVPLRPSRAEPPVAAIRSVRDVAGSASSTRYPTRMNGGIFALPESAPESVRWLGPAPDAGGAEPAPPAPPASSRHESVPVKWGGSRASSPRSQCEIRKL